MISCRPKEAKYGSFCISSTPCLKLTAAFDTLGRSIEKI